MARETIADLKAQLAATDQLAARHLEEKEQEIGHLRSLLDEAHRKNHEIQHTLKLLRTLLEDAVS